MNVRITNLRIIRPEGIELPGVSPRVEVEAEIWLGGKTVHYKRLTAFSSDLGEVLRSIEKLIVADIQSALEKDEEIEIAKAERAAASEDASKKLIET